MRLKKSFVPKFVWKYNKGPGSKDWVQLKDEHSYKRMMDAGVARVQVDAKKAGEEPDYGKGWRINIKTLNKPKRVKEKDEDGSGDEDEDEDKVTESEADSEVKGKDKKRKRTSKKKPKKNKCRTNKKAFCSPTMIFPHL